jgi:hypothetical protein
VRHRGSRSDAARESTDSSVTVIRQATTARSQPLRRPGVIAAVVGSALVLVAAVVAGIVLVLGAVNTSIPIVTDIAARDEADTVVFSWRDPGLADGDLYVIRSADGSSSTQSSTVFTVQADASAPECITVRISRDGRLGDPSAEKCATVGSGG